MNIQIKTTWLSVTFSVVLLSSAPAYAAFEELELGIAAQAMGGTGVVMEGIQAVAFNPASLTEVNGKQISVASRLPFTSLDFATHGLDFGLACGKYALGIGLRYFGSDLYSEQVVSLTGAVKLSSAMSLGIQPMFCRVDIADGVSSYGSASTFAMKLGMQTRIYQRWLLAFSISNPFQARIGSQNPEYLQRKIDIGLRYEPLAGMVSQISLSRDFRGTGLHVGQSLPLGFVVLRAGVATDPVTITGGIGTVFSSFSMEYAIQSHSRLSPTHQVGFVYDF